MTYLIYLFAIGLLVLVYAREKNRKAGKIKFSLVSIIFLLILLYVTSKSL